LANEKKQMVEQEQIAADWAARGFSCDLWTDPPGRRWEDFTHATDEVVIVLEGNMEFEVEGQVTHPQPGEEFFIPAGAVHSARNIGSATARWLYGYRGGA
jgi:quercetin dioxygenase-like cupin family protein